MEHQDLPWSIVAHDVLLEVLKNFNSSSQIVQIVSIISLVVIFCISMFFMGRVKDIIMILVDKNNNKQDDIYEDDEDNPMSRKYIKSRRGDDADFIERKNEENNNLNPMLLISHMSEEYNRQFSSLVESNERLAKVVDRLSDKVEKISDRLDKNITCPHETPICAQFAQPERKP